MFYLNELKCVGNSNRYCSVIANCFVFSYLKKKLNRIRFIMEKLVLVVVESLCENDFQLPLFS
jgi:hypothetical protein